MVPVAGHMAGLPLHKTTSNDNGTRTGTAVAPFCASGTVRVARKQVFPDCPKNRLPASRFCYTSFFRAGVAQLVEQRTENPRVGSSILSPGTTSQFADVRRNTQNPAKA